MEAAAFLRAPAVLRLWRATLIAGLVVLGLHYVAHYSSGGPRLYETWFYEGLELVAALGCLARACFVRAERSAWFFIGAALLATTCGDILYDFWYGGDPPFPSVADVAYLAFYPLLYVGIVLLLRRRLSTFSASLWLDGLMAATAAGALGAAVLVEVVVNVHARKPARRGHEPRLSDRRRAPARARRLRLLGHALATRPRVGADRRRAAAEHHRRRRLPLPDGGRHRTSRGRTSISSGRSRSCSSRSLPGSVPVASPRVELHSRALLGTPFVCGLTATGRARCGVSAAGAPDRALSRQRDDRARPRADGADASGRTPSCSRPAGSEALTDALTGLATGASSCVDLEAELERAHGGEQRMLALFDLNGFKTYNDTFGHPAGDALLTRLAGKLAAAVAPDGAAYRHGRRRVLRALAGVRAGAAPRRPRLCARAARASTSTSAYGAVVIPDEAATVSAALSVADHRLYAHKELLAATGAGRRTSRCCARSPSGSRSFEPTSPMSRRSRFGSESGSGSRARRARGATARRRAPRRRQARDPGRRPAEGRVRSIRRNGASSTPTP